VVPSHLRQGTGNQQRQNIENQNQGNRADRSLDLDRPATGAVLSGLSVGSGALDGVSKTIAI
jgi:hypothetical protein